MTTIYIVRHGESYHNAFLEKTDAFHKQWGELQSPLTEKGIIQAKERAKTFQNISFDAIFSSDLRRAKQTAEILKLKRNVEIKTSRQIRERIYHEYIEKLKNQGISIEQIQEEMQQALSKLDDKGKLAYSHGEGMESPKEATERLLKFLKEIARKYPDKTLLVINHGNNMRSLLTYLGYASFDELPAEMIANTGYIVLETDGEKFILKKEYGVNRQEGKIRIF